MTIFIQSAHDQACYFFCFLISVEAISPIRKIQGLPSRLNFDVTIDIFTMIMCFSFLHTSMICTSIYADLYVSQICLSACTISDDLNQLKDTRKKIMVLVSVTILVFVL